MSERLCVDLFIHSLAWGFEGRINSRLDTHVEINVFQAFASRFMGPCGIWRRGGIDGLGSWRFCEVSRVYLKWVCRGTVNCCCFYYYCRVCVAVLMFAI